MGANTNQVAKTEKRYAILLDMIDQLSSTFERPTGALLHEYILLCRLRASELHELRDYDFHIYFRGPFSEQLRSDLEVLRQRGLIQVDEGRLVVSSQGREQIQKLRQKRGSDSIEQTCAEILADFKTPHAISQGIHPYLDKVQPGQALAIP